MIKFVFKPKRIVRGRKKIARLYRGRYRLDGQARMIEVPLKASDRQVAEKKLTDLVREKEQEREGILAPRLLREARQQKLVGHLRDFLASLRARNRDGKYIQNLESRIQTLIRDCNWRFISDVTADSFETWRAKQLGKAAKTRNEYLDSANAMLNWMKGVQRIDENPLNIVKKSETRGEEVRVRRAWRDDEVSRLLKVAGVSAVGYLLAVQTGLRRGELKALRWGQFDLDGEKPSFRLQRKETKNRDGGCFPLHPELVTRLRAIKPSNAQPNDPVLVGKMLPGMWKMKSDLKKAGVPYKENGRYADFHSLRHTLGTNLASRNVPPRVAMELMRHSDIRLTMNYYTDTNHLPLLDAIAKLPVFTAETNTQIHPQTPGVSSQIRSQPDTQRQIEEPPNIIHPDRFSRELVHLEDGSSGRIRRCLPLYLAALKQLTPQ